MTLTEYQNKAARTMNKQLTAREELEHALFEMSSECGEILGIFQKSLQGHEISADDLMLEIGDLMWGVAELCTHCGYDMDAVAEANIAKLEKRYPNGFEAERSINRGAEG